MAKNQKQPIDERGIYKDGTQRLQEDHDKMTNPESSKKSKKK